MFPGTILFFTWDYQSLYTMQAHPGCSDLSWTLSKNIHEVRYVIYSTAFPTKSGIIGQVTHRLYILEILIGFSNHIYKWAPISCLPGYFVPLNHCLWLMMQNTEQPLPPTFNVIRVKEWIINIERCDCSQVGWLISYWFLSNVLDYLEI